MRSQKIIPFLTVHLYVAMKSGTDLGGWAGSRIEIPVPEDPIFSCSGENRDNGV